MNKAYDELEKLLEKLISTESGRRTFLAAIPLLLVSCGVAKTRYREGDNTGQETELSVADEKRMTAELLPKMKKDYPPVKDAELQIYLKSLGERIVKANKLNNRPYSYRFSVVGVPYVNAFALPAGTIMVTAPLIDMAETESELAGVVGHEVGHVIARHTAERIDRAEKERSNTILSGLGGGILGGAAGLGLGKLLCPPKDNECLARATALGAAAGAGAGLLIRKYQFMAHSREDEMEADRVSFRTSTKAGFDKKYVGEFYKKLLQLEEKHRGGESGLSVYLADAMSTHPPSRERVKQMNEMREKSKLSKGIVSSKDFARAKKRASLWIKKNKHRFKKG